ncbi:MAG: SCP2 sterol-binding domain-containing protein, partial [Deltaproteobacteria bacterium]|nr:SCP2 sterol-binding domain-containing protein [Deltaproteobacteria bacterium]
SADTMAQITQSIDDPELIAAVGNSFWKTCIAEGVAPKAFEKKGMIPRPDTIESFMAIMKMGFNQNAVIDKRSVMQYKFSGSVEATCYFTIETGNISATRGTADKPDITIETPFEVWMDIMTKKADGQEMFMQQKYRVDGDFTLLMRMGELFGG